MGEGESLMIEMPFQSMNAVERTRAKFRTCVANCRGWRLESAGNIVYLGLSLYVFLDMRDGNERMK